MFVIAGKQSVDLNGLVGFAVNSLSLLRHVKHFDRTISQPVANTTHWESNADE